MTKMINFNYPWEEVEQDAELDPRRELENWEIAKAAMGCPSVLEARRMLGVKSHEMAFLLGVPEEQIWAWESGRGAPTCEQKIRIKELVKIKETPINIKEVRNATGLDRKDFARLLKTTEDEVWDWELGHKRPAFIQKVVMIKAVEIAKKERIGMKRQRG